MDDPQLDARERFADSIAATMRERGLDEERDFHEVKSELLPEEGEDAFPDLAVTWSMVRSRLA